MCWSAEISIQTFIVGIVALGIGLLNGMSLPVAFFCFTITLMQLIEFFVWTYYDNPSVNYWSSVAASTLLWIQPIASILTLKNLPFRNSLLLLYGLLSLVGEVVQKEKDYSMTRASNGHLSWNWMNNSDPKIYIYLIVYMTFLFLPIVLNKQYDLIVLGAGTLTISLFTYWRYNTWGSMWCWIVNAFVVYIVGKSIL
jgi:hypothetical protein